MKQEIREGKERQKRAIEGGKVMIETEEYLGCVATLVYCSL